MIDRRRMLTTHLHWKLSGVVPLIVIAAILCMVVTVARFRYLPRPRVAGRLALLQHRANGQEREPGDRGIRGFLHQPGGRIVPLPGGRSDGQGTSRVAINPLTPSFVASASVVPTAPVVPSTPVMSFKSPPIASSQRYEHHHECHRQHDGSLHLLSPCLLSCFSCFPSSPFSGFPCRGLCCFGVTRS